MNNLPDQLNLGSTSSKRGRVVEKGSGVFVQDAPTAGTQIPLLPIAVYRVIGGKLNVIMNGIIPAGVRTAGN